MASRDSVDFWKQHGEELCEWLNIDPQGIVDLTVHIPCRDIVTVEVKRRVQKMEDEREHSYLADIALVGAVSS